MKYHTKTFPNQLRGLVIEDKDSESMSVMILVSRGSRFEDEKVSGIAHFVEHTIFKGTKKRPRSSMIALEVETLGSKMNAFTSYDYTGYYIKSPKEYFAKSIEILSDMFLNSLFESKEIEKERGVILEEKRMYEDQPMDKSADLFRNVLFDGHALGRDIIGSFKSIKNIKREDFIEFIENHYIAENIVVVVAGGIQKEVSFDLIWKYFSKLKSGKVSQIENFVKSPKKSTKIVNLTRDIQQTHLTLGTYIPERSTKHKYPLKLVNCILGRGFGSRLFRKIRDDLGLAYYVYSDLTFHKEVGAWQIGMGVENSRTQRALDAVAHEIIDLKNINITKEESRRAKNYLIGDLTLNLENSDQLASWYGLQLLLDGKIESIDMTKRSVELVKLEQIEEIMQIILRQSFVVTSVSPYKKLNLNFKL